MSAAIRAPLLVAHAGSNLAHGQARPSHRPVLIAVARRSLPQLLEATVVPAVLFYVLLVTIGADAAMVGALCWTYGAVLRHLASRTRPPVILLLAGFGLTCRTAVGLLSGSTFAYFIQPVATTMLLAAVFLGSVLVGRPLVARLADDFCPLDPEVARRPAVTRLFVGLTLLWALVHVLTSTATFVMLISMPVAPFVVVKTFTCIAITIGGVVITVLWSVRTANREKLVFANQPL